MRRSRLKSLRKRLPPAIDASWIASTRIIFWNFRGWENRPTNNNVSSRAQTITILLPLNQIVKKHTDTLYIMILWCHYIFRYILDNDVYNITIIMTLFIYKLCDWRRLVARFRIPSQRLFKILVILNYSILVREP